MLKLELETSVDDAFIEEIYYQNETELCKMLRFESVLEHENVPASDPEERLKRVKVQFSDMLLPLRTFKIIETDTETTVGYLSAVPSTTKFHTSLNLSDKTWEELAPAIHSYMTGKELQFWQCWARHEESDVDLINASYNRDDLFSLVSKELMDAHVDDCLLQFEIV